MAMATGDVNLILAKNNNRYAEVFVGGDSDDGVAINAFSAARNTANDTKGTVSAWINMPDISGTYTIWSVHDAGIVEYIHFSVENGKLFAACMKATTMQWDINSTDVVITPHKWHHVALVQNGTRPTFYVDGVAVDMTDTITLDLTEWFQLLTGLDEGWIGTVELTAATLTQEFRGGIADVKYWNAELTANQIAQEYQSGNQTTDLISHWDFVEDLVDNVSGHNGSAVGAVFNSNGYGELASRLKLAGAVVADDVSLAEVNQTDMAVLIIKA